MSDIVRLNSENIEKECQKLFRNAKRYLRYLPEFKDEKFSMILNMIYEEVRCIIALGCFGSGIVNLGSLLEQILKEAIVYKLKKEGKLTNKKRKTIFGKSLTPVVDLARKEGIIDGTEYNQLQTKFVKDFRNPYIHGRYLDIIKTESLVAVVFKKKGEKLSDKELKKYDDNIVGVLKKSQKDTRYAIPLFRYVYGLAQRISSRLNEVGGYSLKYN